MQDQEYWQAVLDRDSEYDGRFVYAVGSTGIYCRPSCPSRRPRRDYVRFFELPSQAEQAGFRPCRRCQPDKEVPDVPHLELVQHICLYLDEVLDHIPTLEELAKVFNLSPYHLQRTFKRIVGVTPRQYAASRRVQRFKSQLKNGQKATDALYEAGYTSSSSVYEHTELGMTPILYQQGGLGIQITYTVSPCPLGWLLVAATERGICAVRLGDSEHELEQILYAEFPTAHIRQDKIHLREWVNAILNYLNGEQPHLNLPLDIQATAFQKRVWEALRTIPYGSTRTYQDIADSIGQPAAVRAVANACAANPVALVIPCHRVVRKDGSLGGYRWGVSRKRSLLDQEARNISQE